MACSNGGSSLASSRSCSHDISRSCEPTVSTVVFYRGNKTAAPAASAIPSYPNHILPPLLRHIFNLLNLCTNVTDYHRHHVRFQNANAYAITSREARPRAIERRPAREVPTPPRNRRQQPAGREGAAARKECGGLPSVCLHNQCPLPINLSTSSTNAIPAAPA